MARYLFEARSPTHILFSRHVELPTIGSVAVEASIRLGELLLEEPDRLWLDQDWQLAISDSHGAVRWIIEVNARQAETTDLE